jgi:Putative addiction module component
MLDAFWPVQRTFAFSRREFHLWGMTALEIQQMPWLEKLKLMESLWADLSRDEGELESPAWHADVLHETAERRARGEETTLDWEEAKAKLLTLAP